MTDIGIIAIGRNEGERLRRCLASVVGRGHTVVYVDSGSTDGSVDAARTAGCDVVELDMSRPFSAARARNEGFDRLLQVNPAVRYVQFIDGDCEVVPGWLDSARTTIESRPGVAVVCGRRRERFPEASVYNRLADVEWDTPVGEAESCGGDAMMRVDAFKAAGGYDPSVTAGEEPELCQRLREKGWKVLRIDAEMTLHDSAMLRFGQWWKRAVRSGYGSMDVYTRFGERGLFRQQVKGARQWAVWFPAAALAMAFGAGLAVWLVARLAGSDRSGAYALAAGLLVAAGMLMLVPLNALRLAAKAKRRLGDWRTALAYGTLTMLGKWANVIGQRRYLRDRRAGKHAQLIEYKHAAPVAV